MGGKKDLLTDMLNTAHPDFYRMMYIRVMIM